MATLHNSSPGPLPGLPDEAVHGAARAERRRQGASRSPAASTASAAGERHQHAHPGGAGAQRGQPARHRRLPGQGGGAAVVWGRTRTLPNLRSSSGKMLYFVSCHPRRGLAKCLKVNASLALQMCSPIVTPFVPDKSVTVGKRHYSHAYLL